MGLHLPARRLHRGDADFHRLTGFAFFGVVGTAEALLLLGIWLTVASHTMRGMWTGDLFHAPCLCEEMLEPEAEAEVIAAGG